MGNSLFPSTCQLNCEPLMALKRKWDQKKQNRVLAKAEISLNTKTRTITAKKDVSIKKLDAAKNALQSYYLTLVPIGQKLPDFSKINERKEANLVNEITVCEKKLRMVSNVSEVIAKNAAVVDNKILINETSQTVEELNSLMGNRAFHRQTGRQLAGIEKNDLQLKALEDTMEELYDVTEGGDGAAAAPDLKIVYREHFRISQMGESPNKGFSLDLNDKDLDVENQEKPFDMTMVESGLYLD